MIFLQTQNGNASSWKRLRCRFVSARLRICQRRLNKSRKQGVRLVRPAFKLRVELGGHKEGMGWNFDDFRQVPLGVAPAEHHAVLLKALGVGTIELIAMPVAL